MSNMHNGECVDVPEQLDSLPTGITETIKWGWPGYLLAAGVILDIVGLEVHSSNTLLSGVAVGMAGLAGDIKREYF